MLDQLESFILLTSVSAAAFTYLGLGETIQTSWPFLRPVNGDSWTLLRGFWDLSAKIIPASIETTEIRQSLAFVVILTIIGTIISIPKSYYKNFVLEEAHGFNKMTKGTFFADQIKGSCRSLAPVPSLGCHSTHIADHEFTLSRQVSFSLSFSSFQSWQGFSGSSIGSAMLVCCVLSDGSWPSCEPSIFLYSLSPLLAVD